LPRVSSGSFDRRGFCTQVFVKHYQEHRTESRVLKRHPGIQERLIAVH
jgi:hypothetical protein